MEQLQEPEADYYADLGITRFASAAEIKKAHRRLVLIPHPDKKAPGQNIDAAEFRKPERAIKRATSSIPITTRRTTTIATSATVDTTTHAATRTTTVNVRTTAATLNARTTTRTTSVRLSKDIHAATVRNASFTTTTVITTTVTTTTPEQL
ncbi:hypothetical protein GE09DRAFT_1048218 [Coniochaeta sp. 2T2.1]|nr:hypothetical protein GE09DRAFT_1048218 [Coniochaeta sp. 2T2.1]